MNLCYARPRVDEKRALPMRRLNGNLSDDAMSGSLGIVLPIQSEFVLDLACDHKPDEISNQSDSPIDLFPPRHPLL